MNWETILDSLPEGIVAVNARGTVISMNQAAQQITGCSVASGVGSPYRRVFRRGPWISDLLADVTGGEGGTIRAEGRIAGLWGRPLPVRASASPIVDAEGHRRGAAVVLQDLTLQAGLEADLQRARNLSSLGEVVAGLAHEVKNPLSGIRGAVQLLAREIEGRAAGEEYVRLVLREVDRLSGLLEQLLQLGARGALEIAAVNVHEVIDHVLALAGGEREGQSVEYVRLFDPSLPPVRGNRDALVQVLLNLVRNAIQALAANEGERVLRVSTRMENDYHFAAGASDGGRTRLVRIDVEDNGPGIPAELQPNLFSPFVTTKPKGTGLGLAVSHRLVSDLGGTIRLESEPGRTVFRVILPVWGGREP